MSETEEKDATTALPGRAFTRLRRWLGGTRVPQAVEGRESAAA